MKELERQICRLPEENVLRDGLYHTLFKALALVFNASPMSHEDPDPEGLKHFEYHIQRGYLGFE